MTFEDWVERANKLLLDAYGISFTEAGAEEGDLRRYWSYRDTPEEFINWYADKYDLAPVSEVTRDGASIPRSLKGTEHFDRDVLLRECLAALNAARDFSYHHASERRSSYDLAARIERFLRELKIEPYSIPEVS